MQRNIVLNFHIWSFSCCLAKAICFGWSFALPHMWWRTIASFLNPQLAPSCLVLLNEQNRSFYKDWYLTKKRFAIVIAKYFRNLCWKTISVHNCKLVLSLKITILYIFTSENKIYRNEKLLILAKTFVYAVEVLSDPRLGTADWYYTWHCAG